MFVRGFTSITVYNALINEHCWNL